MGVQKSKKKVKFFYLKKKIKKIKKINNKFSSHFKDYKSNII